MDKETIDLIDDVRKALVDLSDSQTGSAQKKTRKVTSQLIWDPTPYLDELDNINSTSKTQAEANSRIRTLIRKSEESALEEITLLPDDSGHHMVQSRTGGDDLTRLDYKRSGPIIKRLSDKHQRRFGNSIGTDGNLTAEMSLSNAAHKFDDKATGLERESGIGKAIPKAEVAHNKSTAAYANMKGVDLSSDTAIESALDSKVTEQLNQAQVAARADAPRQNAVKEFIPGAYQGGVDDIAKARGLITPANTPNILDSYRMLTRAKSLGAMIPGPLGIALGGADVVSRTIKAKETNNPVDKAQAGLATAGMTPGVGIVPDVLNSVVDIFRDNIAHKFLTNARRILPARGF